MKHGRFSDERVIAILKAHVFESLSTIYPRCPRTLER